jgi:hypothetical protein
MEWDILPRVSAQSGLISATAAASSCTITSMPALGLLGPVGRGREVASRR